MEHAYYCGHAHAHAHGDHHGQRHSHVPANFDRAFAIGTALNSALVMVEIVCGFTARSLALLADVIAWEAIEDAVRGIPAGQAGVADFYNLHNRQISTQAVALTAHLVLPGADVDDARLTRITQDLQYRFGIEHSTLQVELGFHDHDCDASPHEPQLVTQIASAVL